MHKLARRWGSDSYRDTVANNIHWPTLSDIMTELTELDNTDIS